MYHHRPCCPVLGGTALTARRRCPASASGKQCRGALTRYPERRGDAGPREALREQLLGLGATQRRAGVAEPVEQRSETLDDERAGGDVDDLRERASLPQVLPQLLDPDEQALDVLERALQGGLELVQRRDGVARAGHRGPDLGSTGRQASIALREVPPAATAAVPRSWWRMGSVV